MSPAPPRASGCWSSCNRAVRKALNSFGDPVSNRMARSVPPGRSGVGASDGQTLDLVPAREPAEVGERDTELALVAAQDAQVFRTDCDQVEEGDRVSFDSARRADTVFSPEENSACWSAGMLAARGSRPAPAP